MIRAGSPSISLHLRFMTQNASYCQLYRYVCVGVLYVSKRVQWQYSSTLCVYLPTIFYLIINILLMVNSTELSDRIYNISSTSILHCNLVPELHTARRYWELEWSWWPYPFESRPIERQWRLSESYATEGAVLFKHHRVSGQNPLLLNGLPHVTVTLAYYSLQREPPVLSYATSTSIEKGRHLNTGRPTQIATGN